MTLRDAGKTDDALKLLDRAVELADLESKSRPLSLRATTYIQIKQLDKAIEDLEAVSYTTLKRLLRFLTCLLY